jgi:hypothetical protein
MKKFTFVFVVGISLFTFYSCGNSLAPVPAGTCRWECVRGTREFSATPAGECPPRDGCNGGNIFNRVHRWSNPLCAEGESSGCRDHQ